MNKKQTEKTHFGYEQVDVDQKADRVAGVFHNVASKYDLMNDLMSLGVHRLWKCRAIEQLNLRLGQTVLDLAGGTGDLTAKISKKIGNEGRVILSDINSSMLETGKDRLLDMGIFSNVDFVLADAEKLPFESNMFDRMIIGFGLRNVTNKLAALKSMYRTLKPGGKALVLEFSKPTIPGLKPIYDAYSFQILPRLGKLFANDADSYRYLAESIRMHPGQEELKSMMQEAGFEDCRYENLSGGIVAIHAGFKY